MNQFINSARSIDARFPLKAGAGSDAIHQNSVYSYAVCEIRSDSGLRGTGLAFTIGTGNELVCQAIDFLSQKLIGQDLEELMSNFGVFQKKLADDSQFRWLGPHKGVVHLALAAVTNACFDLWAKFQGKPLWKLLLDLTPQQTVDLLDFSYIEDAFSKQEALDLLSKHLTTRGSRLPILTQNYKAYDTSVGWFNYSDEQVRDEIKKSMALGFNCMKLKVGSKDHSRDIRRAFMARDVAGNDATIMLDCNQQWQLNEAIEVCTQLKDMSPYWIEEPTHPDDILGHKRLAEAIAPIKVAAGEHVPNRIIFKNYLQAGAFSFNQVDAVRVGGISEFILISLMSKKFNIPVVPHVGDMGQIHQHMVLYNHIAMGHDALFLEYIPHLQEHFVHPAVITGGYYITPQEPGASSDLKIQN